MERFVGPVADSVEIIVRSGRAWRAVAAGHATTGTARVSFRINAGMRERVFDLLHVHPALAGCSSGIAAHWSLPSGARAVAERGAHTSRRGPRAATSQNPAGLTRREVEVLQLLASGLRNSEIASRLVVSSKTVDHHVSAILRKLSVRNRCEASVAAHNLGITGQTNAATREIRPRTGYQ